MVGFWPTLYIQLDNQNLLGSIVLNLLVMFIEPAWTNDYKNQANLDATPLIGMPPPDARQTDGRKLMAIYFFPVPKKCIWPRYDLDL